MRKTARRPMSRGRRASRWCRRTRRRGTPSIRSSPPRGPRAAGAGARRPSTGRSGSSACTTSLTCCAPPPNTKCFAPIVAPAASCTGTVKDPKAVVAPLAGIDPLHRGRRCSARSRVRRRARMPLPSENATARDSGEPSRQPAAAAVTCTTTLPATRRMSAPHAWRPRRSRVPTTSARQVHQQHRDREHHDRKHAAPANRAGFGATTGASRVGRADAPPSDSACINHKYEVLCPSRRAAPSFGKSFTTSPR